MHPYPFSLQTSHIFLPLTWLLCLSVSPATAQGTRSDYQRMNQQRQLTQNRVFRVDVKPNWIHGEKALWYRISTGPGQFEFVCADLVRSSRTTVFNHHRVAEQLQQATGNKVDPGKLPFSRILLDEKLEQVFFKAFGKAWKVERKSNRLEEVNEQAFPSQQEKPTGVIQPSGPSESSIHIRFENRRSEPVRLYWIDREGKPRSYGELAPQKQNRQHSFVGHVWLVTDARQNPLAVFQAARDDQLLAVTETSRTGVKFPGNSRKQRPRGSSLARSNALSPDGKHRILIRDRNAFATDKAGTSSGIRSVPRNSATFGL